MLCVHMFIYVFLKSVAAGLGIQISGSFVQVYLHIFPCGRQRPCGQNVYVYMYKKRKQNVYVYIHKKKNKMHMFTYLKFEAICIALRIHKKSRRQPCGRRRCICLRAYIFFTTHNQHANSSGQASGQKKIKKCIHYIYTKYLFFMFKKCIHYICTRNHTSRQQPFQRLYHYSPTPQTCRQQAEI